jgi:DNA-directed RNA polymerase specialized sigma24 family protein
VHDESSFEAAIEPFRRELHVHCYRLLGGLAEADDLVQETLLRAWRHRGDVRDPGALRGWLLRIATNACLDHYASANGSWEAQVLQVLDVAVGGIADVVAYLRPDLVARTGLPARLE